jgi:hypothetical protein
MDFRPCIVCGTPGCNTDCCRTEPRGPSMVAVAMIALRVAGLLLLLAIAASIASAAEYRREPKPGASILTAAEIIAECQADLAFNGTDNYPRFVSVAEAYVPHAANAGISLVANSTISRTSNIVQTELVGDYLVRIDLGKFAVRDEDLREILSLWELLESKDTFFRSPKNTLVKLTDGTWKPCRVVGAEKGVSTIVFGGKTLTVASNDLKTNGAFAEGLAELQHATGSRVPVIRYDEFVASTFSTVNGGLYAQWSGVNGDLRGVIERFAGRDAADKIDANNKSLRAGRVDPALSQSRALVITSAVTGRQRMAQVFFGAAGQPTVGPQLIAVTYDLAEDNADVDSDPTRNLRQFQGYDGGEFILSSANGLLLYGVFDANDKIIESVPDKVAADTAALKVRGNVHTTRVFSGISCANCHDQAETNLGWQPVANDALEQLRLLTVTDDLSSKDRRQSLQELVSQYGATDLESVLNLSRLPYQKQVHRATGVRTSKEVVGGLADAYWGYVTDRVTPRVACLDLGQSLTEDDAQAYLLRIPPAVGIDQITEDAVLARLKDGRHTTPAQWRSVRRLVAERAEHIAENGR